MLQNKIKELRTTAGMNKATLARHVGVSDVTIGYWENGTIKNMSADKLLRIADTFAMSVSELLDDPRKNKPGLELAVEHVQNLDSNATTTNNDLEKRLVALLENID